LILEQIPVPVMKASPFSSQVQKRNPLSKKPVIPQHQSDTYDILEIRLSL
jgi:hypothetical protein